MREMDEAAFEQALNADANISFLPITKAKRGDLYILGPHRLLCGDALNDADVDRLMSGALADTVFLDPSYEFTEHQKLIKQLERASKDAHIFVMHSDDGLVDYLRHSPFRFKRFFACIIPFASPRGNDPYLRHILISHEEYGAARKHINRHDSFSSVLKIEYRHTIHGERIHAHQKAVKDIKPFLRHYGGNSVMDLFGGSGTTLLAAAECGITCYMMEFDPVNIDLIINRYESTTGISARQADKEAIKDEKR